MKEMQYISRTNLHYHIIEHQIKRGDQEKEEPST